MSMKPEKLMSQPYRCTSLSRHFVLPPVVWSSIGPVRFEGVGPECLVQSKLSCMSCSHPHRFFSKSQFIGHTMKKHENTMDIVSIMNLSMINYSLKTRVLVKNEFSSKPLLHPSMLLRCIQILYIKIM